MAYQIGFYMDSIRRRAEISLKAALQEVRQAGYEGVELAGLFGNSPEQVREWARAAELTIISAQVGIEDFLAEPGKTVLDYQELGCAYITLPGLTEKWRKATNYRWLVKQLDLLGEYCNQFNLQLLYRNQAEELLMKRENGESILANLLVDVPDYFMKLEADTAWLTIAGEDAAAYLHDHAGRSPLVHIKDFVETAGEYRFCPLGQGTQAVDKTIATAFSAGVSWIITGQDGENNLSPEAMRHSAEYLQRCRKSLSKE